MPLSLELSDLPTDPRELANYYRTCWLSAHNALHELCHQKEPASPMALLNYWREYMAEFKDAAEAAKRPA